MTFTSDERREVAARLRQASHTDADLDVTIAIAILETIGEVHRPIAAVVADLIDPEAEDNERFRREAGPFCDRLREAAAECADVTLFGVDYIAVPVDADGEYIHIGDVMEWPYGNGEFIVEGIGGNTLFYIDKDSNECEWTAAGDKRHRHAPTVEDVLREFAKGLGVPVADSYVAAAAAKLRLAEGVDE